MALTVGYVGATGRDLGFGGSNPMGININQIDPEVARAAFPGPQRHVECGGASAPRCRTRSLGLPARASSAPQATIQAGQLLRPFPQFGDVFEFESHRGGQPAVSRRDLRARQARHAVWGGRLSYTWSSTKDNQFGQDSTFQTNTATPAEQLRSRRRIRRQQLRLAASHHPGADRQVPRRRQRRCEPLLLSGWNASAVVEMVSGAPLNAVMSSGASDANLGLVRRPAAAQPDRRSEHRRER